MFYYLQVSSMKKTIIFIMGTWCSGKTTNFNYILSQYANQLVYVPSYTTRDMREGEKEGERYYFVSRKQFEEMIERDERLEYASAPGIHRGNYYGTRKSDIDKIHDIQKLPIKEIEIDGLATVLQEYSERYNIVSIFLTISDDEMRKRISLRQTSMNWENLEERILHTQRERDFAKEYCSYVVDAFPSLNKVQASLKIIMDSILI